MGNLAFTFRRVLPQGAGSGDGYTGTEDAYTEVDIEAEGLREMLKKEIGTDYPGQNFDGETINMTAPFAPLVSATPLRGLHQSII